MKARTPAAALAAAALVGFAGAGQSNEGGIGRPLLLRTPPTTAPLLGIRWNRANASLVRLDPRTLMSKGHGLLLERAGPWSFSPDRQQLALASKALPLSDTFTAIRFIDVSTLRPLRDLALERGAGLQLLHWVVPERLLMVGHTCCPAAVSVSLVDATNGSVLAENTVEGNLAAAGRAPGALVLLIEPVSFGPVRLAVAGAGGTLRSTALDQIRAGPTRTPPPQSYLGLNRAGLAVDPSRGRAYVVAADNPVAEVDLTSLAVSYHTLSEPVSVLGRLHDWLEPAAQAKEAFERRARFAVWLGDGRLAVFGRNGTAHVVDGRLQVQTKPSGLSVIDTSRWTSHVLDPRSSYAVVARKALLSFGWKWDSRTQTEIGNGLRVYRQNGSRQFRLFGRAAIAYVEVVGARAFVAKFASGNAYSVVSLTSGRVLRTIHRELPLVLRGDGPVF